MKLGNLKFWLVCLFLYLHQCDIHHSCFQLSAIIWQMQSFPLLVALLFIWQVVLPRQHQNHRMTPPSTYQPESEWLLSRDGMVWKFLNVVKICWISLKNTKAYCNCFTTFSIGTNTNTVLSSILSVILYSCICAFLHWFHSTNKQIFLSSWNCAFLKCFLHLFTIFLFSP